MTTDAASVEALKRMLSQVETLISTTTPLPENRSARCVELLRAASALTDSLRSKRGSSQPEMDGAADEARAIFERSWRQWDIAALAQFWREWHIPAGHRRLGRMLMEVVR
jgi:hypothetical protein